MTLPIVSRAEAIKRQTRHQFIPGIGYLAHASPPDLPAGAKGDKNCAPPPGTTDGSVHMMQPPGAHPPFRMLWVTAESAWANPVPGKGNRLAWPVDHLSKAGWAYVGPVKKAK